jgi:excisionase family DNA binding protein
MDEPLSKAEQDELLSRLFVSVADTARLMGVDHRTIRRAIADGDIPAVKIRGRIRIRVSWIKQQAGIED